MSIGYFCIINQQKIRVSGKPTNPSITIMPRSGIEPLTRGFSVPCSTD
jgi:hypothetical protein